MRRPKGAYKRGNVWWVAYTLPDGRTVRESAKTSNLKEAEYLLLKRKGEVLEGRYPTRPTRNYTFQELAIEYLEWAKRQKTYKDKVYHVRHFLERFGNLPLRAFTTMLLETWQSEMLQKVSPARTNRLQSTLKHAFTKAVEWEMTGEETLKAVRRAKLLPINNRRLRYLPSEECQALINACASHLRPIIITALNTGMRKGEILGLKWNQVDLKHGFILLDKTKNGERRELPINATLKAVFESIPHGPESEYVFTNRNGNPYRLVRDSFEMACKRAGIHDFHFHDLRHCFASHLVMGGVDITTVKELLGHKTLTMTLRYAHLAPSHKVKAVSVLEERLVGDGKQTVTSHLLHNFEG